MLTAWLLAWLLAWPWPLSAQTQEPADSTITLTKTVEVYTFEDLTFTIDSYTVAPGDNLAGILRRRGLWPSAPSQHREEQLIRLVRQLNPAIANPDLIEPGQDLYLPAPRAPEPEALPEPAPAPALPDDEPLPPGVVAYSFNEPPAASPAPAPPSGPAAIPLPVQNLNAPQNAPAAPDPEPAPAVPDSRAPAARVSGNDGPIEQASDGTVYRTVRIRRGDTLEKILRREGVDPNLIYRQLIKVTLSLNPELKNPNIIATGAEIRIPANDQAYYAQTPAAPRAVQVQGRLRTADTRPDSPPGGRPAPAAPERRTNPKFTISTKRLPPAPMPTADSQNAKTILGIIFTRLGEKFTSQGRLFLPLDEPPHFDVNTAQVPVIELRSGRKIVLDLSRSLSPEIIKRMRDKYQDYMIFQPVRGEALEKVLEKLWPMCGYWRVYSKTQAFEGGRDVKLKISSDWLIWPTAEAWNRGQPAVINFAPAPDSATPPAWVKFLASHGITVIDLYKGMVLAESSRVPTPINNFTVINVDSQNPSAFASSLIRSFGFSPRLGVRVDLERGRIITGGAELGPGLTPPVFWDDGSRRIVLEYGDLSSQDLETLRRNDFQVISSGREIQTVLKSVLSALNIKLDEDLVLNGSSAGGPAISLTLSGQSFFFNGRSYLFTAVDVPDNMVSLDPNQNVVVLKYRPAAGAPPAAAPAPAVPPVSGPPVLELPEPPEDSPSGPIEVSDL
ncbi:MAG: LysM peptidoglycan-binding domain-containing protein [Deltaproteobacteria bacterium]|nr:LysM peptidoglycan-binding domain-containing protein [Deltaproteobacteria bacterium]